MSEQLAPENIPSPTAVVGAGWLGSALVGHLRPPVIVTSRTGQWSGSPVPTSTSIRQLDVIRDPPAVIRESLGDARAVVICYAPGKSQDRTQLYVEGSRRLAEVLSTLELERVVYTSSTSALPDIDGWVDESCTRWPDHERGRVQRIAEEAIAASCTDAGIPWIVLRLAGLYGPGRELDRIYRSLDPAPLPGDGMSATNLIHRDDAVTAILAALSLDRAISGIVHVCDDDHTSRREMYRLLAERGGSGSVRWAEDPAPGARERGKRVSNARMKAWLRVNLRHPRHTPAS